ncbi:hypothetical protein KEJ18_06490 [Candidatus Bathyarchaeota archaeon]|nr:hypothetical protein [Candidatus Bathyarchaeota archaeon]
MTTKPESAKTYLQASKHVYDRFDELLVQTIDEVLKASLGDKSAKMIYEYLEKKSCSINEIPNNLTGFSTELRAILANDNAPTRFSLEVTPQGRSTIIERTIARILCQKLGLDFKEKGPVNFPNLISELRRVYNESERSILMVACQDRRP